MKVVKVAFAIFLCSTSFLYSEYPPKASKFERGLAKAGAACSDFLGFIKPPKMRLPGLKFKFAKRPGEKDQIFSVSGKRGESELIYEGVIKRIPILRGSYRAEGHRHPRSLPKRVSFYDYNPHEQFSEYSFTVVVEGGTFVFDVMYGNDSPCGRFLGCRWIVMGYRIPREIKYAAGATLEYPNQRDRYAWRSSSSEVVMITVREGVHGGVKPIDVVIRNQLSKLRRIEDEGNYLEQNSEGEWVTRDGAASAGQVRYEDMVPPERYSFVTRVPTIFIPDPISDIHDFPGHSWRNYEEDVEAIPNFSWRQGPIKPVGREDYSGADLELDHGALRLSERPGSEDVIPLGGSGMKGELEIDLSDLDGE